MFHLFTHAFFKALLFLGAGSVMHAMAGVIDIRRFGGLRRLMPKTHWTFLFGCLALAGVVPFAGFFSKDEILIAVHENGSRWYQLLYWAAVFTAFLTAFYTFRAFFWTFYGKEEIPDEAGDHAHESPPSMTRPLMILAVGAAGAGFLWGLLRKFLERTPSLDYLVRAEAEQVHVEGGSHWVVMAVSTVIALAGIGLAAWLYLGDRARVGRLARGFGLLYRLSHAKFLFDEIYSLLVVWPLRIIAWLSYWFDRHVIDAVVNLFGRVPVAVGATFRSVQSGMIQFYVLAMVLGLLVLMAAALLT
jgi:NADH-quinone oxidoreductase subunit L